MLIDFRELIGEHSGENMAKCVWETLESLGLTGRVSRIFLLNAILHNTNI
jgi:hypothetical protein